MIRVLNIISDTNIGGAGRVILNYLRYADTSRFETHVALPRGGALKGPLLAAGALVHEVDGMADKSLDLKVIRELEGLIDRVKPDIVHTHGSLSGRIAGRRRGCKVIFTRHSAFPVKPYLKRGPGRWLNGLVNGYLADRIIAVSPATAENLTDSGVSPKKIEIMMNGVEPLTRRPPEACAAFRRERGILPGDFVMGIVARVEPYKGHEDILRAMARIGRPELKLLVAGTGSDEERIKALARELGLGRQVIFLGFVEDVATVFSVLDVQVNASWGTEASSMAMLEGFSLGVGVIASDYGGNPWQVEDGVSGILFKARDIEGLAGAITALMDSPTLREKLSCGAAAQYKKRFTGRIFAGRIEEIYTKTLEDANGER